MAKNRIILSAKVSAVQDLIAVYQVLAQAVRITPSISASPRPQGTKGIVRPRRPRSASSCSRASATPSAFR